MNVRMERGWAWHEENVVLCRSCNTWQHTDQKICPKCGAKLPYKTKKDGNDDNGQ